uniref:Uncharacterized protein n=1 Tax=Opuntia streptacantha TaxID=393608 RepID=A0A7C9AB79_OPUST
MFFVSCSSLSPICLKRVLQNCFIDSLASATICKNPSTIISSLTGIKESPGFPPPSFSPFERLNSAFFSSSQCDSRYSSFIFNSPKEDFISETSITAASLFLFASISSFFSISIETIPKPKSFRTCEASSDSALTGELPSFFCLLLDRGNSHERINPRGLFCEAMFTDWQSVNGMPVLE